MCAIFAMCMLSVVPRPCSAGTGAAVDSTGHDEAPNACACACVQMLACAGAQFNKGNLFIKLKVKFPKIEDMEPEMFEQLSKLLPASPAVDKTEEVCPCVCARGETRCG